MLESGGDGNVEKIPKTFDDTGSAVLRLSTVPLPPFDPNLPNAIPAVPDDGGNVPMEAAIKLDVRNTFPAVGLEARSEIMNMGSGEMEGKNVRYF